MKLTYKQVKKIRQIDSYIRSLKVVLVIVFFLMILKALRYA